MNSMIQPALQNALDAVNAEVRDPSNLIAAKVRGLMAGYDARWRNAGYVPLSVEIFRSSPLFNPDTGKKSRSFDVAGKLDVIAEYGGRRVLIDHKTTTQDIQDPNASYWSQLRVDSQVSHYLLLQWLNGERCENAVWDVIRKPGISPRKLSAAEKKAVTSLGEWFGSKVSEADKQAIIAGRENETPSMYEARLRHDCTQERPEWYFQRQSVMRIEGEILEYARELWRHGQDILAVRNETKAGSLPIRNSKACLLYGSPCKFLGICSGHDSPDSSKWQPKANVHNELPQAEDGRNVLTNSRIGTFQTCQRKHFYEYELGIERIDEEEREALFFGSLFHVAQEAWWSSFLPQEVKDECYSESAATAATNSQPTEQPEMAF